MSTKPSRGGRLRRLTLTVAAVLLAGFGVQALTPAPASAATLSTTQAQWNLAGLAYLTYADIDGANGPKTQAAAKSFQVDRCMDADGAVGPLTGDQLVAVMKLVQAKVGVTQDGLNGPSTKSAIITWQKAHGLTGDGLAGPATMTAMGISRTRICGGPIVGSVLSGSSSVACFAGTTDLGTHTGYYSGTAVTVRLCAIPGLKSSSDESTPGNAYYVAGANGNVIVSSRVSGPVLGIYRAGKNSGLTLSATSSFRTMRHQQDLCNANAQCRAGDYTYVAKPGTSPHQLGVAIDFAGTNVKGGSTCATRATNSSGATWSFLERNARRFGFEQYSAESWHWDARTDLANRC
jgi:peptidoglycan hydrolase-like protein with peptidoglycan-binding domain